MAGPSDAAGSHPPQANAALPRDAKVVSMLLKNHGIDECEPKVLQMLMEYAYRYCTDVLQESLVYADHASRSTDLTVEDVRLATQSIINISFLLPPSREVTSQIANERNSIPLPPIENEDPIKLPPEEQCLLAPHYHVISTKYGNANPAVRQNKS